MFSKMYANFQRSVQGEGENEKMKKKTSFIIKKTNRAMLKQVILSTFVDGIFSSTTFTVVV